MTQIKNHIYKAVIDLGGKALYFRNDYTDTYESTLEQYGKS
jgi:hypothetical protein